MRLDRPRADTLLLTPAGGDLRESWSTLVRAPDDPFRVGDAVQLAADSQPDDGVGRCRDSYCHACFSGDYPLPFEPEPRARPPRLVEQ